MNSPSEYPDAFSFLNFGTERARAAWMSGAIISRNGGSINTRRKIVWHSSDRLILATDARCRRYPWTCRSVRADGTAGESGTKSRYRRNEERSSQIERADASVRNVPVGPVRRANASSAGPCQPGMGHLSAENVRVRPSSPMNWTDVVLAASAGADAVDGSWRGETSY